MKTERKKNKRTKERKKERGKELKTEGKKWRQKIQIYCLFPITALRPARKGHKMNPPNIIYVKCSPRDPIVYHGFHQHTIKSISIIYIVCWFSSAHTNCFVCRGRCKCMFFLCVLFRLTRREAGGFMMSPPCLEFQGCQFDPTFLFLLSCSSA